MPLPWVADIEVALLQALVVLGGEAAASSVYPEVTKRFPALTPEQIAASLASGGDRWTNRIQWVRLRRVQKGEMASPAHGRWAITEKGRARVQAAGPGPSVTASPVGPSLIDLYEDYDETFGQGSRPAPAAEAGGIRAVWPGSS